MYCVQQRTRFRLVSTFLVLALQSPALRSRHPRALVKSGPDSTISWGRINIKTYKKNHKKPTKWLVLLSFSTMITIPRPVSVFISLPAVKMPEANKIICFAPNQLFFYNHNFFEYTHFAKLGHPTLPSARRAEPSEQLLAKSIGRENLHRKPGFLPINHVVSL